MQPVLLILAGGKSQRFWPLFQKNLFPLFDKPLLFWQLKSLFKVGFKEAVVVGNPEVVRWGKKSKSLFKEAKLDFVAQEANLRGMGGAVLSAEKIYRRKYSGRPLYLVIANDFYEEKLHQEMLKALEKKKAEAWIAAYKLKEYLPMGFLEIEKGRIKSIVEKPPPDKTPSDMINIAAHLFSKPEELFKAIRNEFDKEIKTDDHYERALDSLMKEMIFEAVPYQGRIEFLKYPWHVLSVMKFFLDRIEKPRISSKAQVSDRAEIVGNVIIEDGVRIFSGAKIVGPCYIGQNTIIGDNSLVRESVVEKDCVVGYSSDITRSYLGQDCWTHTNYVGDSILEGNISLGSGAVTGNLRLDEKNIQSVVKDTKVDTQRSKLGMIVGSATRFGVNASIMPGVKIGQNCFVGPGVVLEKDLEDGKFCLAKQELIVKENKFMVDNESREKFKKKI